MPRVSSTPRSAGGTSRGATVSSSPRSLFTGSGRRTSPTPRGYRNPLTGRTTTSADQQATLAELGRAQDKVTGVGPAFTPLGALLKAVTIPAYAVGKAIRDPSYALDYSAVDAWKDKDPVLPGGALRERGALNAIPTKFGLRGITEFAADVALDPTTYVAFGAGAAVKGVSKSAAAAATKEIDDIIRAGGRPTLAQVGRASAMRAAEAAAAPHSLKVGVRVPFTRGKQILLGESQGISRAVAKIGKRIGSEDARDLVAKGFATSRGVTKAVNDVFQDLRRAAQSELKRIGDAAKALDDDIAKAEKAAGLKRGQGAEAIARSLDNPTAYKVPEGFEDLAERSRSMLDDLNRAEKEAGIEYREVEHYVPHVGASPKDRRRIAEVYAKPTAAVLDEPFFVKPRDAPNLDAFEAAGIERGFRPELNIARLVERRARASVNSRMKKALDDAIFERFGTRIPDRSPDEAFEEWMGLTSAAKHHADDALPPDITEGLRRVHERITPLVKDDDALERTRQGVARLTSRWKALALLSPGYGIRNLYDDGLRSYWAGARNPQSFAQAARVLRSGGGKGSEDVITIRGEKWTRDELLRRAEAHGVTDTGWVRTETESSEEFLRRHRLAGPGRGPAVRASQGINNFRENTQRLGTWIELLKRGDDPADAARTVREFLFEYGETGLAVERAREFWIPFITFTSKAIPFTLREAARRPGRMANVNKAMTALNEAAGNEDLSLLPSGSQSSFGVPFANGLARRIIGAPDDQALMVNPERLFAMGTLNLLDPRISRLRQNVLGGMLNPGVRAPLEIATNKSFYLGSDLPRLASAPALVNRLNDLGIPIPTYVPAGAPGGKKNFYTGKPIGGYSAYLDTLLRLFPQYGQASALIPGGGNDTAQLAASRFFFGVPVSPFDRAKALKRIQQFGNP